MGGLLGLVGSTWGGIEMILPVTTVFFGCGTYIAGLMAFFLIDTYRQ